MFREREFFTLDCCCDIDKDYFMNQTSEVFITKIENYEFLIELFKKFNIKKQNFSVDQKNTTAMTSL